MAPQLTPEQIAAIQEQEGQGTPAPEAAPAPQPAPAPEAEIAQAAEMLGVTEMQQTIEGMQEQMDAVQHERVKAQLSARYPDIPYDLVQKEIDKIETANPDLHRTMNMEETGMEMAYKAAMIGIEPKDTPDNLTEGEGGGENTEDLDEVVKNGKATDLQLGAYLLKESS